MKKNLLVTVNHIGRIPPLYQDGPIINPIRVDLKTASVLVSNHYKVFEHNPRKIEEKVALTHENLTKENFPPYIPQVKHESPSAGKPVPTLTSVNLPKPDKKPVSSAVETSAKVEAPKVEEVKPAPEVSNKSTSEVEEEKSTDKNEVIEEVVDTPVEEKTEEEKPQKTLTERAAELGIDTTGLSRNKIRAAIREKEKELQK